MAGTSVLKLKVDDKEYNASLRQAQQGMQHLEQALQGAGKTFNQVDKAVVNYVRGIGQMEAQSKTARGRIGEMTSAFVELSQQYNKMSDDVKQGDVGKALAQSMEQLKQRTIAAKQELHDLTKQLDNVKTPNLDSQGGGLFAGMTDKMSGMLQVFGGNMITKAAGAVASLGSEMVETIRQSIELAKQGEGIRIAFERLGRGDILDGLRQATHGTVSDIELMKAAVKFNDFKLPVEELGMMLAFAQQKAKDTGQSVDYMVDSIVKGLSRKSLMILDNLGLSANEVKEKMKETGDMTTAVGAIIREQMSKAGEYVETAADRAAQANVSLQNKMEELGRKFAPVEEASTQLWTSMKIAILDVVGGPLANLINSLTEAGRLQRELNNINSSTGTGQTHSQKTLGMLKNYRGDKQELYNRQVGIYQQAETDAWRRANNLRTQLNNYKDRKGKDPAAYDQSTADNLARRLEREENRAKALQSIRVDYQKGAQPILNPVNNTPSVTTQLTTTTKPSKVGTKNTVVESDADKAAKEVQQAEKNYANEINNAQLKLAEQIMTSSQYDQQVLNGQQKLADAYLSAYNATGDERYLESFRESAKHMKDLQTAIEENKAEQKASAEAARNLQAAQKKLADAQQKLTEAQATGSSTAIYNAQKEVNRQQEKVNRLKGPTIPASAQPTGIEAYKQTIQAEIKFDQKNVDETTLHNLLQTALSNGLEELTVDYGLLQEKISQGIDIPDSTWESLQDEINEKLTEMGIEPIKINFETGGLDNVKKDSDGASKSMQAAAQPTGIEALKQTIQAEIKFDQMNVDETTLRNLLQTALSNGLEELTVDYGLLQEKISQGIDIPDSTWESLQDEINEKLTEMGIEPIKINFETGGLDNVKKDSDGASKSMQAAAQAASAVGSALQTIEDPGAKILGIVAQAIATIAQGFATATTAEAGKGIWGWIAAIAAGTATMVSTIATIHSATGYANGGVVKAANGVAIPGTFTVPGSTYSGDQVPAMLNAGETVLTRAQAGNIVSQLDGNNLQNLRLETYVDGRALKIVLNNDSQSRGKGKYVTSTSHFG